MNKPKSMLFPILAIIACLVIGAIISVVFAVYVATSIIIPLARDYNIGSCRVIGSSGALEETCHGSMYHCTETDRYVKDQWACGTEKVAAVEKYPCYHGNWKVHVLYNKSNTTATIKATLGGSQNTTANKDQMQQTLEQMKDGQTYTCYIKKKNNEDVTFELPDTNKHITGVILFVVLGIVFIIFAIISLCLFCKPLDKLKKRKQSSSNTQEHLLATYETVPQSEYDDL